MLPVKKLLIFGKGGISAGVDLYFAGTDVEVTQVPKDRVDVRDMDAVLREIDSQQPDWVMNCAGVSDRHHETPRDVIETNLLGTINVARAAGARPTIHMGSCAGFYGKPGHPWYSASKAGVITFVQSWAALGFPCWSINPGRVDTEMREADWPGEDPHTRLRPTNIGVVVNDIMDLRFSPGAAIVIRKVGLERVDYYEVPQWAFPSGL